MKEKIMDEKSYTTIRQIKLEKWMKKNTDKKDLNRE